MGIKLEWQQTGLRQEKVIRAGEDPAARGRRRRAQRRFIVFLLLIILAGTALVGGVVLRLREVDSALENGLRAVVEAEAAALRLGDRQAFLDLQWQSEDDPAVTAGWLAVQEAAFSEYESLKLNRDLVLSGRVIDVTLDGQNGRTQVEEIIDGVPYGVLWFYWRFEEGWRHVPPAYGFWGEAATLSDAAERFSIDYRAVDAPVAAAMLPELARGFDALCGLFSCVGIPPTTIEIVPQEGLTAAWSSTDPWRLQVASPYLGRARLDRPFDSLIGSRTVTGGAILREALARAMTDRWLGAIDVPDGTDAAFLRDSARAYLIEQFSGIDTEAHLLTSFIEHYGASTAGRIISGITPETRITALAQAVNAPVAALQVDWRDYLTHLLEREGVTGFSVVSIIPETLPDGRPALRAIVTQSGIGEVEIVYVLNERSEWQRTG